MEHRWGRRVPTGVIVRLDARPGVLAVGLLRNASVSGGYVQGVPHLPLLTGVHVELEWGYRKRLETGRVKAHVVRSDSDGLGLEWGEFAPDAIRTLIAAGENRVVPPTTLNDYLRVPASRAHFLSRHERDSLLFLSPERRSPGV